MRALVVQAIGEPATLADVAEPTCGEGESLLSVVSAPLNPIDVAVAAGRSFAGHPRLPYVVGVEAVGRVVWSSAYQKDDLVFTCLDGLGTTRDGACSELVVARDATLVPLPSGVDPSCAAALGTAGLAAWIPLTQIAPVREGDVVLVLGATGTVGRLAVSIARSLGAKRVVAAGRREAGLHAAAEAGADAVVRIGDPERLADELRAACGGDGPTLVFDPLWGQPLVAALEAAVKHARVIQLGQSAAPVAEVASGLVRGKNLQVYGYTTLNLPLEAVMHAYRDLIRHHVETPLPVDVENVSLEDAAGAWLRQVAGPGVKLVIRP